MKKHIALIKRLKRYARVAVCYSGGVDSSYLLATAVEALGADNTLALIAISPIHSAKETENALRFAKEIGARAVSVQTNELSDERFVKNDKNRCYFCKCAMIGELLKRAKKEGFSILLDGSNQDDSDDRRSSIRAAKEYGVITPLLDIGVTKTEVRVASRAMKLSSWNAPSNACLAFCLPYGAPITASNTKKIEDACAFLKEWGFPIAHVRYHGDLARIEIPEEAMPKAMSANMRKAIDEYFRSAGFSWTTLDIVGYRTGNLGHTAPKVGE